MTQIFISYRRADGVATVGRLYDRLVNRYGDRCVFWDLDTIAPGRDFREEIRRYLETSDVALVVVSPEWLGCDVENRLHRDGDYVRIEIETAVELQVPLVPVLILGARLPAAEAVPDSVAPVLYCHAVEIGDGKAFNVGYEELVCEIDYLSNRRHHSKAATAVAPNPKHSVDPSLAAIASLLDLSKHRTGRQCVRLVETLVDLRYIWEIDNNAYGDANVSFEVYSSWWLAYRQGLYALYSDDRPVGALGLWPVPQEWLDAFRGGSAREADLMAEHISEAGNRPAPHWYVSGVVLDPAWQHTNAITILLRETTLSWAVDCDIAFPVSLSAMAISTAGERLLAKYGFSLTTPSFKMKDGYSLYERLLQRRDLRVLASFGV